MSEEAPPADPAREAVRARVRQRLGEADRLYRQGQPTDAVRLLEPLLSEFDEAERQSGLYAQVCLNLASALAESGRLRTCERTEPPSR
jgi:hypothetical protein